MFDPGTGCYLPQDLDGDGVRGKLHKHGDHPCHSPDPAYHCTASEHWDERDGCHPDDPSWHCPNGKHIHEHNGQQLGCHPDDPGYHDPGVVEKIGESLGPIVDDVGEFVIITGVQVFLCLRLGKFVRFVGASSLCSGTLYAVTEVPSTLSEIRPTPTTAAPTTTTEAQASTAAYCSAFESRGRNNARGEPVGEVVLHRRGAASGPGDRVSYQGSRSWAEAACQRALGQ